MNVGHEEVLVGGDSGQWFPVTEGIELKPLRLSDETGTWTVIFRCQPGSKFAPHFHHGPGEFYMICGTMEYRMGRAVAGDYGYEPLGAFHECTMFPVYSELLFTNHGPIAFVDDKGEHAGFLDYRVVKTMALQSPSAAAKAA